MTRRHQSKDVPPPPAGMKRVARARKPSHDQHDGEALALAKAMRWTIGVTAAAGMIEKHGSAAAAVESMMVEAARDIVEALRSDDGARAVCTYCDKRGAHISVLLERHYSMDTRLATMEALLAARDVINGEGKP